MTGEDGKTPKDGDQPEELRDDELDNVQGAGREFRPVDARNLKLGSGGGIRPPVLRNNDDDKCGAGGKGEPIEPDDPEPHDPNYPRDPTKTYPTSD